MTVFGSRDFDAPRGRAAAQLAAAAAPATGTAVPPARRRVVVRVQDGDDIVVGMASDRDESVQLARRAMRLIDDAEARGEWPQIGNCFIRPGAIVSIDVQRVDVP